MSQRGQGMHTFTGMCIPPASYRQGLGTEPRRGGQTGDQLTWGLLRRVEQWGGQKQREGRALGWASGHSGRVFSLSLRVHFWQRAGWGCWGSMSTMFHKSVESIHSSNHSGVLFCGIVTREQENTVCRGAAVFGDARSRWQGGMEELPEDVTHRIVLSTVFSSGASKHAGGRDMVHPSGRHPAIPDQLEVGNHGARHEQRAAQRPPCTETTSRDPRRRVEAPPF